MKMYIGYGLKPVEASCVFIYYEWKISCQDQAEEYALIGLSRFLILGPTQREQDLAYQR
jgi:hypothetical protein